MSYEIEGSGKIQQESCCDLILLRCSQPDIIEMNECSSGAVVGETAMVVTMEEVVVIEVLRDLIQDFIFYQLTNFNNVRYWPIIFTFNFLSLLVVWMDQLSFPFLWKCLFGQGVRDRFMRWRRTSGMKGAAVFRLKLSISSIPEDLPPFIFFTSLFRSSELIGFS